MPGELSYAISKGAVHQMTLSLADALAERGITVNAIHPGPVDTGWASGELRAAVAERFPTGRWGTPADIAPIVRFLVSPESAWVTGQVVNAEGGFRR
jgi:3-oxoacyl-[acyl-carrier protein] reductase